MILRPIGLLSAAAPSGGIQVLGSTSWALGIGENMDSPGVLDLSGWGLQEGDLVALFCCSYRPTEQPSVSGYSSIFQHYPSSVNLTNLSIKWMGSAPDTSLTVTNSTARGAVVAIGLRGVDPTTPLDATPTSSGYANAPAKADSPAITTVTDGVLVLSVARCNGSGTVVSTIENWSAPAGYDNVNFAAGSDATYGTAVKAAAKLLDVAGMENPGQWADMTSLGYVSAFTVAFRPA
jgi:hypothetical protein